jgi:hypothetical protein
LFVCSLFGARALDTRDKSLTSAAVALSELSWSWWVSQLRPSSCSFQLRSPRACACGAHTRHASTSLGRSILSSSPTGLCWPVTIKPKGRGSHLQFRPVRAAPGLPITCLHWQTRPALLVRACLACGTGSTKAKPTSIRAGTNGHCVVLGHTSTTVLSCRASMAYCSDSVRCNKPPTA